MANAPTTRDWTRIYVAQRADAGKQFGNHEQPTSDGKKVPRMDAAHARELLKYWLGAAAQARGAAGDKPEATRKRLDAAIAKFRKAMEPFAASVVVDLPKQAATGTSILLARDACVKFWQAVWGLASSLSAAGVAPDAADLWWSSVAESARDLGNAAASVVKTGVSWVAVAACVVGGLLLLDKRR